jgi:hypothetical protein
VSRAHDWPGEDDAWAAHRMAARVVGCSLCGARRGQDCRPWCVHYPAIPTAQVQLQADASRRRSWQRRRADQLRRSDWSAIALLVACCVLAALLALARQGVIP